MLEMWVQELATALKLLSGCPTIAVLVNSRVPIDCAHAANVGISILEMAPAVELLQDRCSVGAQVWEPEQAQ